MQPAALLRSLLANGPFGRDAAPYRLLTVAGPDAAEFLQRLCTQDVLAVAIGSLAPAALLDAKGKLQVTCLLGRLAADRFVLETQAEQAERLAALLDRYHFTEKLTLRLLPLGPCWERIGADAGGGGSVAGDEASCVVVYARRGVRFERRHGGGPAWPAAHELEPARAECLRMLAGLVRVGVDTEPTTLALEADLDDHCSTTKGCYTGQEIVARIHTYGHVNRRLCLLELAAGPAVTAPVPVHDEDDLPVGRVMHAVLLPDGSARLGFGYLPKDFQAPGTKLRLADGGAVTVLSVGGA
ncbi:MAG: hypothetical protein U1F60_04575 [Planctomycetota bacterium]